MHLRFSDSDDGTDPGVRQQHWAGCGFSREPWRDHRDTGISHKPDRAEESGNSGWHAAENRSGRDSAGTGKGWVGSGAEKAVANYSLGMRQRLGIAQAIMEDPKLLILDEPFNGLDKHGVGEIRKLLLELKEEGKTILLASHNEEDIRILCDEVYEMDGGVLRKCEDEIRK